MAHFFHSQKPSEVQSTEATINSAILQHCNSLLHIQALPYPWRILTIGVSEAYRAVTTESLTFSFTLLLIAMSKSWLIMEKKL